MTQDSKYIGNTVTIEKIFNWRAMWVINRLNEKLNEFKLKSDSAGIESAILIAHESMEIILHECGIMAGFDIECETHKELKATARAEEFARKCLECIDSIVLIESRSQEKRSDDLGFLAKNVSLMFDKKKA